GLEWITKDFVNSSCVRDFLDLNVVEAWNYFDELATLSHIYYHSKTVEEVMPNAPPSPSVALLSTEITNDGALMWGGSDSVTPAFVESESSNICDGDFLEICDE
ncbi:hypothetical protein Dimus_013627, partial [Dionaea muscipula]